MENSRSGVSVAEDPPFRDRREPATPDTLVKVDRIVPFLGDGRNGEIKCDNITEGIAASREQGK
jgi:hypothetical protein